MKPELCSLVIPFCNEAENLPELHERLVRVMSQADISHEIILVDDGSTDSGLMIVKGIAERDRTCRYVSFSRNFGHEAATTAGLDRARGDVVVLMDADLQDPPELIPEMLAKWREGYEVVYARRRRRQGETGLKLASAWIFYRVLNLLSEVRIPEDVGDFRLMDRLVVDAFRGMPERSRFIRGMIAWLGFRQTAIEYDRPVRSKGATKYHSLRLVCLAVDATVSFSTALLRLSTIAGFTAAAISFAMALIVIAQKVFFGIPIPGYALIASGLFFLGGTTLLSLGILGEYVGKTYRQVQSRPLFVIREETRDDEVGTL